MTTDRTTRPYRANEGGSASQRRTVANTGIAARLVPADEDADTARALIHAYAGLATGWQQLCERLSAELQRSDLARLEAERGQSRQSRGQERESSVAATLPAGS